MRAELAPATAYGDDGELEGLVAELWATSPKAVPAEDSGVAGSLLGTAPLAALFQGSSQGAVADAPMLTQEVPSPDYLSAGPIRAQRSSLRGSVPRNPYPNPTTVASKYPSTPSAPMSLGPQARPSIAPSFSEHLPVP